MGGIGEAMLAIGASLGEAASAAGGALATGAETVGGALATGAEAVGEAVATGAEFVGDTVAAGAESVGEFASGMWEQGTDLAKTMSDVVTYDNPGMKAVVQKTPEGLTNVTKFTDAAGNTMYMGDIASDINWSKTLGNLTGQTLKSYALGKVGMRQKDAYNLLGNVKDFGNSGNLTDLLGDDRKIKKYGQLLSQLTGSDLLS